MSFIDYYKVLGVPKDANEQTIKKAYRKLARKYHPDLNPGDQEAEKKFKEINEANEVLSHQENRKKYDEYGKDWQHADAYEQAKQQQNRGGNQQRYSNSSQYNESDFSDFFESMFGGASRASRNQAGFRGQDYNAELQLDLKDVYVSHKRTLTVNGKNIRITIPAGIENGQVIKISGHGGPGANNGPKGDLFITFTINNNSAFQRDKANLYKTVDLDLYTALLGGHITVETFDGKVKLTIKPETQNGTRVKLKGKGFPVYKKADAFGDLFIMYTIKTPTNLTEKEKELFTELSKLR